MKHAANIFRAVLFVIAYLFALVWHFNHGDAVESAADFMGLGDEPPYPL